MTKTREEGNEYKKGLWTVEEDKILMDYVREQGKGQWNRIAKKTGLKRCGKSCRLRWMNYLSPNVKRGNFTEQEEDLIIRLHKLIGNRWSLIAKRIPGRTDNQVKNYWNTHLSKKPGIKDQTTKTAESSLTSSPVIKKMTINSDLSDKPHGNGTSEFAEEKIENSNETHHQLSEIQAVPVIDERTNNSSNSFWIQEDDFELSSLTMMDFVDGYCF